MRQVRRLEKVVPGLVNAVYSESIAGIAVIRAFGAQSMFTNGTLLYCPADISAAANHEHEGHHHHLALICQSLALLCVFRSAQADVVVTRVVDFAVVTAVLSFILLDGEMSAATAGFVLSFVSGLSSMISASLMNLRDLEVGGVSLERREEYRRLPQEVYEPGEAEARQLSSRPGSPE